MKGVFKLSTVILCISCIVVTVITVISFIRNEQDRKKFDLRDKQRTYALQDIVKCLQHMCVDK